MYRSLKKELFASCTQ